MPKPYQDINGVVFLTAMPGGKYQTSVQHRVTEHEAAKNAIFRLRGKPDSTYWRSQKHMVQKPACSWLLADGWAGPGPPSTATCRAPPAGWALYRWCSHRAASPGSGDGGVLWGWLWAPQLLTAPHAVWMFSEKLTSATRPALELQPGTPKALVVLSADEKPACWRTCSARNHQVCLSLLTYLEE